MKPELYQTYSKMYSTNVTRYWHTNPYGEQATLPYRCTISR